LDESIVCNGNVAVTGSSTTKKATIQINTTGSANEYHWYESLDGSTGWTPISSNAIYDLTDPQMLVITPSYDLLPQSRWHKCVITGCTGNEVTTNIYKTTLPGIPTFFAHPDPEAGGVYTEDNKATIPTLYAEADNAYGGYTWYATGWKSGSAQEEVGDDDVEYTPEYQFGEKLTYYVVANNYCGGTTTSNSTGEFIYFLTPEINDMSPLNRRICAGESVEITLRSPQEGIVYGVYEDGELIKSSVGAATVGTDSKTWIITPSSVGTHTYTIRSIAGNGYIAATMNGEGTVVVNEAGIAPKITTSGVTAICADGGTVTGDAKVAATLSIENYDASATYKLYKSGDDEAGAGRTFSSQSDHTWLLTEADTYWVYASKDGACGGGKSNEITIANLTPTGVKALADNSIIDLGNPYEDKQIQLTGTGLINGYTGMWSIGDHQHVDPDNANLPQDPAKLCHFSPNNWNTTWGKVSDFTTAQIIADSEKKAAYQTSSSAVPLFISEVPSVHDLVWTVTNNGCSASDITMVEVISADDIDGRYFVSSNEAGEDENGVYYWGNVKSWRIEDANGVIDTENPPASHPTGAAKKITIKAGHTIVVKRGQLVACDVTVYGKLIFIDGESSEGTITLNGDAKIIVKSGGVLENKVVARNPFSVANNAIEVEKGGQYILSSELPAVDSKTNTQATYIPTINWKEGSKCVLALDVLGGVTYNGLTVGDQAIEELEVNMINNEGIIVYPIKGSFTKIKDMTVLSTGTGGTFQLSTNNYPKNSITGNYKQTGGTVAIVRSTDKKTERIFMVGGNFTMTGGEFIVGEYASGTDGISRLHVAGDVTISGGKIHKPSVDGQSYFRFTGIGNGTTPSTSNFNLTGGKFENITGMYVNEGKTLNIGSSVLTNSSIDAFEMIKNSTIVTPQTNGLDNFLPTATKFTVGTGAGYVFSGTAAQNTGSKIIANAATLARLEVKNTKGVTLSKSIHLNDLTLTSGNLILEDSDLTILEAGKINGTTGKTKHVVTNGKGNLIHKVLKAESFTFPVGYTVSDYNPIIYNNSNHAETLDATMRVRAAKSTYPNGILAMWHIDGDSDPTAGVTINWTSSDENASFVNNKAYIMQLTGKTAEGAEIWDINESSAEEGNTQARSTTSKNIVLNNQNRPITIGKPLVWYKSIQLAGNDNEEQDFTSKIWYRSTDGGKYWYNTPVAISESEMTRGDIEKIIISDYSKIFLPKGDFTIKSLRVEATGKLHTGEGNLTVVDSVLIVSTDNSTAQIINTDWEGNATTGQFIVNGVVRVKKHFPVSGRWSHVSVPFSVDKIYTPKPDNTGNALMQLNSNYLIKYYDGGRRARTGDYSDTSSANWVSILDDTKVTTLGDMFGGVSENGEHIGYQVALTNKAGGTQYQWLMFQSKTSENGDIFKEREVSVDLDLNSGNEDIDNSEKGWNLRGNPYTANFDLTTLGRNCYVYDPVSKSYGYVFADGTLSGHDGILPPYGAFFVQVDQLKGITDFVYDRGGISYKSFRSSETQAMVDRIRLYISDEDSSDETYIWMKEETKPIYVVDEDAIKMPKSGISLYSTTTDAVKVAANALPREETTIVPLSFSGAKAGAMSISRAQDDLAPNVIKLILRDKKMNTQVDLLSQFEYPFTASAGADASRFELEIGLATDNVITGKGQRNADNGITMSIAGNNIVLHGLESSAKVMIFDLAGRQMTSFKNVDNNEALYVNLKGAYIVKVVTATQTFVQNTFFNR
jgi:hypothetical protein